VGPEAMGSCWSRGAQVLLPDDGTAEGGVGPAATARAAVIPLAQGAAAEPACARGDRPPPRVPVLASSGPVAARSGGILRLAVGHRARISGQPIAVDWSLPSSRRGEGSLHFGLVVAAAHRCAHAARAPGGEALTGKASRGGCVTGRRSGLEVDVMCERDRTAKAGCERTNQTLSPRRIVL